MLPVTVVGAGVARTIMGADRFQKFLHDSIQALGLNRVQLNVSESGSAVTLGSWLTDIVTSGMNVNIAALTWVGVLVLIYSAITLLVDIETCFNSICRAKRGRQWLRRLPLYWFVLTFGPVFVAIAFWADAKVVSLFFSYIQWEWLHWGIRHIWDFAFGWISLLLLYRLVPTVKLELRSAMIGASIATLLLLVGKGTLGLYFNHAMSLRHMYGSLGLVPVFMFWLYLMWLIILLGLQVSAILHNVSLTERGEAADK
jgi:membrane protein